MCPFRNPSDPAKTNTTSSESPAGSSETMPQAPRQRSKVEFNLDSTARKGRHYSSQSSDEERHSSPSSPLLSTDDVIANDEAASRDRHATDASPARVGTNGSVSNDVENDAIPSGSTLEQSDKNEVPKSVHKSSFARLRASLTPDTLKRGDRWRKTSENAPPTGVRPRMAKSDPLLRRMRTESYPPTTRLRLNVSESSVNPDLRLSTGKLEGLSKKYGSAGRALKKYYRDQSELIEGYKQDAEQVERNPDETKEREKKEGRRDSVLAKVTLALNFLLLIVKIVAAAFSGSYAVISSVVDSAVDIASGLVIWVTGRAIKRRDPYLYPRGRTRLEPLAVVIVSVIMAVASVQMIGKSLEAIFRKEVDPRIGPVTLGIMISTILTKFGLAVTCYVVHSPQAMVLFQDHRNDCLSNTVAIACGFVGAHYWKWADPIGAIVVSVYIVITWAITGNEQIRVLTGMSASPDRINRIIKLCLEHDSRIQLIDTVLAYHYGTRYLVEVHVVMDPHMSLKEAHDVAEPLQNKLELLEFVERAFVHIDYETDHDPAQEHKTV